MFASWIEKRLQYNNTSEVGKKDLLRKFTWGKYIVTLTECKGENNLINELSELVQEFFIV